MDIFHLIYIDLKILPATWIVISIIENLHFNFAVWYLHHGDPMSRLYEFYIWFYVF